MKKTVIITGASRGIGAQTAREFAKSGYNVVINYFKSEKEAFSLAEETGGVALSADISDETQAQALVKAATDKFGRVDVLVNNAGIAKQQLFTDTTAQEWDRMFAVNVRGAFNCSKAVLDRMITEHSGCIINISSMWGQTGGSCEVAYSASKAAVIGMTKALAKEVGPAGIRVNCVAPGVIKTDMLNCFTQEDMQALREETPLGMIGEPIDVAKVVLFLASEEARFITGQIIAPNGGMVI